MLTSAFWKYFWHLIRRSFHGAFRILEISEAAVAAGVHTLGYYVPAWKEGLEVFFVLVIGLFIITFVFGLIVAAHLLDKEKDASFSKSQEALAEAELRHGREIIGIRAHLSRELAGPLIKATRVEIARWIETGNDVVKAIEDYTEAGPLPGIMSIGMPSEMWVRSSHWIQEADRFVKDRAPSFFQHYQTNTGIPPRAALHITKSQQFTQLRDQIADRVDRLQELLESATQS